MMAPSETVSVKYSLKIQFTVEIEEKVDYLFVMFLLKKKKDGHLRHTI